MLTAHAGSLPQVREARPASLVVWDPSLLKYDFGPGHPMAPTRLDLTMGLVNEIGLLDGCGVVVQSPPCLDADVLCTVHDPEYVAAVQRASAQKIADPARGLGTDDDPVFAGMHEAAARIAGGSWLAAGEVWSGRVQHAVNIAGGMHHAKADAASGFCVYNDAAIAIRRLLDEGAKSVAYVDLDAHHGDGVERIFWDDERVLTVSVHQSGVTLFPGTGSPTDVGGPRAHGSAVNVGLPPRTGGAAWLRAVDAIVPPVIRAFAPDVLVTQHGCDSHAADPLSDLRVPVDSQRMATAWMHRLAHEVTDGRWIALGGGGYAVALVVPFAWTCVIGEVVHRPVDASTHVPDHWRERVEEFAGYPITDHFGRGDMAFMPWSAGYDPADDVDRAILATRRAAFPALGLDPHYD